MEIIEHIEYGERKRPILLHQTLILELEGKTYEERKKNALHYVNIWVDKDVKCVSSFEIGESLKITRIFTIQ